MVSWYCFQIFFGPLIKTSVAQMITGVTKHFMFHISSVSIRNLCIFIYLQTPSVVDFYILILLHLAVSKFYLPCF